MVLLGVLFIALYVYSERVHRDALDEDQTLDVENHQGDR